MERSEMSGGGGGREGEQLAMMSGDDNARAHIGRFVSSSSSHQSLSFFLLSSFPLQPLSLRTRPNSSLSLVVARKGEEGFFFILKFYTSIPTVSCRISCPDPYWTASVRVPQVKSHIQISQALIPQSQVVQHNFLAHVMEIYLKSPTLALLNLT